MSFQTNWKTVLSSILEELTEEEFRKMLLNLDEIPQGVKDGKAREEIPDLIVQCYGTKGSISEIGRIMKIIPRNDSKVQNLLRPFVEKLKKHQEEKGTTSKLATDTGSVTKKQKAAAGKKWKREEEDEEEELIDVAPHQSKTLDQQKSSQPEESEEVPSLQPALAQPAPTPPPAPAPQTVPAVSPSSLRPIRQQLLELQQEKIELEQTKAQLDQSAAVQSGKIRIVGIEKSNKTNTHLMVDFNGRMQTVIVTTRLLANTFGLKVDNDFERRLRYQMPLTAEAKLQGKKVTDIKKMLKLLEAKWETALSSILEELTEEQFKKMLIHLVKIPQGVKTGKAREDILHLIVQYYGTEGSISVIDKIMNNIPRRDAAIQEPLRPFVKRLTKCQKGKGTTSRLANDPGSVTKKQKPAAVLHQTRLVNESNCPPSDPASKVGQNEDRQLLGRMTARDTPNRLESPTSPDCQTDDYRLDQQKSSQPDEIKSFHDVKHSRILEKEVIVGKVVQKSELHMYETKEKEKKFFFYLAVADETASVKVIVCGKDRFQQFREQSSYLFGGVILVEYVIKVTATSKVSETSSVDVPEELEMEARELIYPESPIYSIQEAKLSSDKTEVSVEGEVTKVKFDPERKRQQFQLKDNTGFIEIFMWGDATEQCRGLSVGDVVKVSNVKTSGYTRLVSLNSTVYTRIEKMTLKLLEAKWKPALSSILEQLIDSEFRKMLFYLDKIPREVKKGKAREEIPDLIVQYYGTEGSISEIDKIMKIIPRNDAKVQKLLLPFVEKLKQRQEEKAVQGSVTKKQNPAAGPSGELMLEPLASAVDCIEWTELQPVVNTVDEVQTYSFQCDAGRFECSVSALRWVCEEKLSFRFQFCSWDEHRVRLSATASMPAGPLLDITVTAGKMEEVQLPHWICVDHKSKMSDNFAVLHIDTCGDVWREVSEVTRSHVKLLQPTFSPISVAFRRIFGFPVKVFYDVLIYMKKHQAALTLHVYLLPPDESRKQEVEKMEKSYGSVRIIKPGPDRFMQLGDHHSLSTDKTDAKIQPSRRELRDDSNNLFEVFIRNADSDVPLRLDSEQTTIWTCTIYKENYLSTDPTPGPSGAIQPRNVPTEDSVPLEMSRETKWRIALISILEELTDKQFAKMMLYLDKIPQGVKTGKAREDIPNLIIEYYETEGSISEIDEIMKEIPRNDPKVQNLLRPFVEKLK